jgi:hypothetical protein
MWSLTLQRVRRISGPENFQSSAKKDFFNKICQFQTFGGSCGSTNLHHPQVISCASRAEWNAGDYHD